MTNRNWKKAFPLLLVLFIDGMGLGLVFPVLNQLIMNPDSEFYRMLPQSIHSLTYGTVIGVFMLFWFLGAAVLGDLSDYIGRKKSLGICLIGSCLGYLISAIAVIFNSLSLLIIGRVIAGLTSGSQPIAQAAIIDISDPKQKTRSLSLVLLALSLGFILGPIIGGILSNAKLSPLFNLATPFYFAALISLLNFWLLQKFFTETFIGKGTIKIKWNYAIEIISEAFRHENINQLTWLYSLFMFAWSSFYSFVGLYLLQVHHASSMFISIYMMLMGLGFTIGNIWLVKVLTKRFSLRSCYFIASAVTTLIFFLTVTTDSLHLCLLLAVLTGCFIPIAYSSLLALFSDQVDENKQGWIMGIAGSLASLIWGVNAIVISLLFNYSSSSPLWIAVSMMAISILAAKFLIKKPNSVYEIQENLINEK